MAVPAHAAASAWAEGDQASLRLVSAADAVGSEAALAMGLQVRLKPTWKIYWRSPGDAGHPGAREALGGELGERRGQDAIARPLRISDGTGYQALDAGCGRHERRLP